MNDSTPLRAARYGELFAYYGELLASETKDVLALHLDEDFSLAEIAARYGFSRQAISARIRRGLAELERADEALALRKKDREMKRLLNDVIAALDRAEIDSARALLQDCLDRHDKV